MGIVFICERATKSSISRGKKDQKYTLTFVPSLNLFNIFSHLNTK